MRLSVKWLSRCDEDGKLEKSNTDCGRLLWIILFWHLCQTKKEFHMLITSFLFISFRLHNTAAVIFVFIETSSDFVCLWFPLVFFITLLDFLSRPYCLFLLCQTCIICLSPSLFSSLSFTYYSYISFFYFISIHPSSLVFDAPSSSSLSLLACLHHLYLSCFQIFFYLVSLTLKNP